MKNLKKSLGQNLLNDKNIRNKIIKYTDIVNKKIIEIGPGTGFLTDAIIHENPNKLVLIEKDRRMYCDLIKKYKNLKNVEIHNQDALYFDYNKYVNYNIISNLPYNISSKLILIFFEYNLNFNEIILMIQKELAQKLDYNQGKMNKYKFLVNFFSKYKICFDVTPNVFYPKPKVNSSLIKMELKKKLYDSNKLNTFIKVLFKSRRKIISNLIKTKNKNYDLILKKRVEELKFSEILRLYQIF